MNATLTVRDFVTEGTGGGCAALVRYLTDGRVVVVTDGNLSTDLESVEDMGTFANVAVFASVSSWEGSEDNDPVWEFASESVSALFLALSDFLGTAR